MADTSKPNPWVSLATSRKSIVAVGAVVIAGSVIITGMLTHADKDYVLGFVTAVGALAFKLIGAIAIEDAANSSSEATLAAVRHLSGNPGPPAVPVTISIPPAPAVPQVKP